MNATSFYLCLPKRLEAAHDDEHRDTPRRPNEYATRYTYLLRCQIEVAWL